MSERQPAPRPRQVTLAVIVALTASVLLVFSLFDTMGGIRSDDTRTAIEEFLSRPPGDGLGLEVTQVVGVLRALVFLTAAFATATAVLAVFVLQRHRGARIGLTVAAGLLLLTAPVSGLLPLLVAVAAVLLWSAPARAWFAGRAYAAPERPAAEPPAAGHVEQPEAPEPRPQPSFGGAEPPTGRPGGPPPYPPWAPRRPTRPAPTPPPRRRLRGVRSR